MKKIFIILICLITVLAGCSNENNAPGMIKISINDASSKGISPIVMDAAYYIVSLSGPDGASDSVTLNKGNLTSQIVAKCGSWTAEAIAYNSSDEALGSGTGSCVVKRNETASCSITVNEYQGNGTLKVNLTSDAEVSLEVRIYTASDYASGGKAKYTIPMVRSGKIYSASQIMTNGFYQVEIAETSTESGKVNAPLNTQSVRIVNARNTVYELTRDFDGSLKITINNNITSDPKLVIKTDKVKFKIGDNFSFNAETDLSNAKIRWMIDNNPIDGGNSVLTGIIPASVLSYGKHTISCIASNGTEACMQSVEIEILAGASSSPSADNGSQSF